MSAHNPPTQARIYSSLQRQWLLFTAVCISLLAGGSFFMLKFFGETAAFRWALLTAVVMGYQVWLLRTSLGENHRLEEGHLLPWLGWGNVFSLLRGVFFAGLTGFLFLERPTGALAWLPALLYTLGALIDFVDGYAARVTNHVTRLGEKLDMSLDGWGMLVAAVLAVKYGQVPPWYLLVGAARYLFLIGLWVLERLHKPIYDLPPSVSRRGIAGLQMGFTFVILWPVFTPPGTQIVALIFSLPLFVGFLRDWLVVSGVVKAPSLLVFRPLRRFATSWAPLLLRLGVVVVLAVLLFSDLIVILETGERDFYPRMLLLGLELLVWLAILTGTAGRGFAITGLILLGFHQVLAPLSAFQVLLAWLYGAVMYLGTGLFSLWKPEDWFIFSRAGE